MNISRQIIACCALASLVGPVSIHAETRLKKNPSQHATDPAIVERILATQHLATLPDGSFIAAINGRQKDIRLRPGDKVTIIGKGFDQRRDLSFVSLFPPDRSTGAMLNIISWSDSKIVATVPVGNSSISQSTTDARLSVQVVRPNGFLLSMNVTPIALIDPGRPARDY